jgi:hypothetical protein
VLSVIVFAAFWIVLALALFFVAVRGGLGGARDTVPTQPRRGRKGIVFVLAIVYIGFGVAIPLAFIVGNHARASDQIGGIKLTEADKRGRVLFGQHCGVCHTLAAANAVGKVGPNLDTLKPTAGLVLHTINNGCLQNPGSTSSPQNCLGQGTMPPGIYEGKDAQDVANFVAKVAGKE